MAGAAHYGTHSVSGAALLTAIDTCTAAISGCTLVSVANGTQIAVIGTGVRQE